MKKKQLLKEWKKLRKKYGKFKDEFDYTIPKNDFSYVNQLIDISDLDEKIKNFTDEEITSLEIWKTIAPDENEADVLKKEEEWKKWECYGKTREYWIADQVANTILARCLILQNRLFREIDEKWERKINKYSLELLRCPYMKHKGIELKITQENEWEFHRKNLELCKRVLNKDPELIDRIKDLPWIKLPEILITEPEQETDSESEQDKTDDDTDKKQEQPKPKQKPAKEKEDPFLKKITAYSKIEKTDEPITEGGWDIRDTAKPEAEPEPDQETDQSETDTETELTEKQEIEKRAAKEKAKIEKQKEKERKEKEQAEKDREQNWLAKGIPTLQDLENFNRERKAREAKEIEKNNRLINWVEKENEEFFKGKQPKESYSPNPIIITPLPTAAEPIKRKPLKFVKYKKPEPAEETNEQDKTETTENFPQQEPAETEKSPAVENTETQEPEPENPQPNQEPQETEPNNENQEQNETESPENNNQNPDQQENQSQQGSNWFSNFSIPKKAAWVGTIGLGSCLFLYAGLISIPVMFCGLFIAAAPVVLPAIAPDFVQPIQNIIIIIIALWILYKIIKKIFKKKDNNN